MINFLKNLKTAVKEAQKASKIEKLEKELAKLQGKPVKTAIDSETPDFDAKREEENEKLLGLVGELKKGAKIPEDLSTEEINQPMKDSEPVKTTTWNGIPKSPSQAQIELIEKICKRISMKTPSMEGWTSSKASDYIKWISEQQKELSIGEEWTERQKERLSLYVRIGLLSKLPEIMPKKEASDTIESFKDAFSEWELNHTSKETIFKIWSLQRRIAGLQTPSTICINCGQQHYFTIASKKCDCGTMLQNKQSFLEKCAEVQTPEMELRMLKKSVSQALIEKLESEISNTSRNNYAQQPERMQETPILNWCDLSPETKENLLFALWEEMGRKVNKEIVNTDYSKLDSQIEKSIDGLQFEKSNAEINNVIKLVIAEKNNIHESEVYEKESNLSSKPEPVKRKAGRPRKAV